MPLLRTNRRVTTAISLLVAGSGLVAFVCTAQLSETLSRATGDAGADNLGQTGAALREAESAVGLIKMLALLETTGGVALLLLSMKSNERLRSMQQKVDDAYNLLQDEKQPRATDVDVQQLIERAQQVSRDVGEARRKEKAVVDRAVDVVCILDLDGRFAFVSPACRNAWGWTPDELHGQALSSLLIGDDSQEKLQSVIGAANSIQQVVFECQLKKKDGSLVDVEWTGHWSVSDAGFFCIVHDISEKKRLERLQREFLAMVTHDLRSPISGMQGVLALMEAGILGRLTEDGQQITSRVRQNCKRLVRLLNDMLDLDKAGSGKFVLECCNFPLNAAIEQAIVDVRQQADEKQVSITTPEQQLVLFGDEDRLTQVLANLLGNAIKFAPDGSTVAISAQAQADSMRISVSDQGRGIPQDKLDVIFEKFEQVTAADAKEARGVGLGLAICKTIVEEHGGAIGVESAPGAGSTFWFTVPQAQSAQSLEIAAGSTS